MQVFLSLGLEKISPELFGNLLPVVGHTGKQFVGCITGGITPLIGFPDSVIQGIFAFALPLHPQTVHGKSRFIQRLVGFAQFQQCVVESGFEKLGHHSAVHLSSHDGPTWFRICRSK